MKIRYLPGLAVLVGTLTSAAQTTSRYVTITKPNARVATNTIALQEGEIGELIASGLPNYLNGVKPPAYVIKDGIKFPAFPPGVTINSYVTTSIGTTVSGPAEFAFSEWATDPALLTVKITPGTNDVNKTVVLPPSSKLFYVTLECSTNFVNWSDCTNGIYGSPETTQYFRIRTSSFIPSDVVSVAMVNDPNRDLSGLDPNKNSQTECSFAILDNTNIVAAFMNTHLSEYALGELGSGYFIPTFTGIPSPRMTSWAVSTNGGMNFTDNGPLLPLSIITNGTTVITNGASDPMHGDAGDTTMAYDPGRNVVYLLVNTSRESTNHYGFRLWSSANKGRSFNPVNMDVPGLNTNGNHLVSRSDKPMIKVNPATHTLYAAGSAAGNNIWAALSTNGGTSWNLFKTMETNGTTSGGVDMVIVPDGTVYFFWLTGHSPHYPFYTNSIRYAWLTTNAIWSYATNIGPQLNSLNFNASGRPLRSNGAGSDDYFDNNGFPRVAYANGKIYITYADLPATNSATDHGDIFLIEAEVNWTNHWLKLTTGPRKVDNDRTQTDQWNPSIAATPSGTELFVGYYSRQNDPTNNSLIMAYGSKAFITNGLASSTFESFPISPTAFAPLFCGSRDSTPAQAPWLFDPVFSPNYVCLDNVYALYDGYYSQFTFCTNSADYQVSGGYEHFCADDYTWAVADSDYFYFAWCDRSRTNGTPPYVRPDADVKLAKIKF